MRQGFLVLGLTAGRGERTALPDRLAIGLIWTSFESHIPNSLVKNALQVSLGQSRALEVLLRLDIRSNLQGLLVCDGRHLLGAERFDGCGVLAQIELGANQDDGDAGGMVFNLGVPLEKPTVSIQHVHSILRGGWTHLRLNVVE
jgi:hypothetical protein